MTDLVAALAPALAAVEAWPVVLALRRSLWVYPLINTGHIVGLALLFGAILPLDLRLLGFWRSIPIGGLARILVPVAVTGLLLAVGTGALLFSVRATEYAEMPLFQLKLLLVAAASANALLLRGTRSWDAAILGAPSGRGWLGAAGALSIVLWLAAITAGRLIGYR